MKHACSTLLLLLLGSCAATAARQEIGVPRTQRASLYLGLRSIDELDDIDDDDDFSVDVADQPTYGLEYSREDPGAPVGWEIGFAMSEEDDDDRFFDPVLATNVDVDVEASTTEFYGGVRKSFGGEDSQFVPYVGGGLAWIDLEIDAKFSAAGVGSLTLDDDDDSIAAYIHGGALYDITENFFVGLDLRLLFGSDLDLFDESGDADYFQYTFVIGTSF